MRWVANVRTKNYNPCVPQTPTGGTPVQLGSVARGLALAADAAFKRREVREEYNRWLEAQAENQTNE
jgi:hypothetical protein